PLPIDQNEMEVLIPLARATTDAEAVKAKIDKGIWLWKNIDAHKPQNNRYKFDNISYQLYNKLEMDLKNFNSLEQLPRLKPLLPNNELIAKNTDTSEGTKILPTSHTEALSHYYYQKNPLRRREEIIAA